MPIQINSFILPDNIIKDMKDKIKETKKIKKELGFALCTKNNIIEKGSECVGTQCIIKVGKCRENQIYVGNYHTHPIGPASLSIADMATGCLEDIECVGSAPFKNIRCFTRKTDKSQCYNEIIPYEEEERKIAEKSRKIVLAFKNPKLILEMGISQFLSEFRQHDKEIGKYHSNRIRLLDKNFNKIDI